jgi:phage-related protein
LFIGEKLIFDDIDLYNQYGLINVDVGTSGMKELPFGVKRSLIEEQVNNTSYLMGTNDEPLSFRLQLTFADNRKWDIDTRREIVQLLFQKNYKPILSQSYTGICWFVIAEGESKRFDNYLEQGYIDINFRCDASHGWSYPAAVQNFDFTDNSTTTTIELENMSNVEEYYMPEIEFTLTSGSALTLKNLSDGGREFTFSGITTGETIYVNNKNKRILTSLGDNFYRLSKFNKSWLKLSQGKNYIEVTGKCNLQVRSQFPMSI